MSDTIEPVAQETPADNPAPTEVADRAPDLSAMKIAEYFNLGSMTVQEKNTVLELARIFGPKEDVVDLLWEIKNIENRIGTPPVGTTRLQHVFNFAKLNTQIKKLEGERDLYVN